MTAHGRNEPLESFEVGQRVLWNRAVPGERTYVHPVPARVTGTTAKRVRVEVRHRDGTTVTRHVKSESIEAAPNPVGHAEDCQRHGRPGGYYDIACSACGWSGCSGHCGTDGESVWCPSCGDDL